MPSAQSVRAAIAAYQQSREREKSAPRRANGAARILVTVLQRLALGVLTLLAVSVIIFATIELLPGDFARAILGQSATGDTVAAFRSQLGLDRPPVERYWTWLTGVLHGDFGDSFSGAGGSAGARDVATLIGPRLANTLFLAGITAAIAVPLSIVLGLLAALYRNSLFDRTVNLVTLTTISVPEFFIAYVVMLFLAVQFPLFPSLATISSDMDVQEKLLRIALPVLTLVLGIVAHMMRMTRAAIVNLLARPYIEMARLKGLSPFRIVFHHALPNAWAPIATVVALNLAYLIVGVVVVEVVFVYPGIGQLMVDAVSTRDVPVVQACAIIFAAVYILLNLLADVLAIVTNPRLLHP